MSTLSTGQTFANRYRLIRNIGSGGFSEVWLAADQMAGDLEIALKIYAPGQGLDEQAIQIFRDEYKVVFYLNHPNLLKPSHFDINEGKPYLVLPYCAGGSVMKMTGHTDEATLAKLMVQIGGALHYLHAQDPPVIHRDIKPENVLADTQGNFYLCDFGISSKLRRTLTKSMGRSQESSGTTAFMAPELFQAKRSVVQESDIFAFGTMLYELITDELPFGQIGGAMLMNGAEVPDISESCSPGLADIVGKCLNISPQNRPSGKELMSYGKTYLETGQWTVAQQKKPAERKTIVNPGENRTVASPGIDDKRDKQAIQGLEHKVLNRLQFRIALKYGMIISMARIIAGFASTNFLANFGEYQIITGITGLLIFLICLGLAHMEIGRASCRERV